MIPIRMNKVSWSATGHKNVCPEIDTIQILVGLQWKDFALSHHYDNCLLFKASLIQASQHYSFRQQSLVERERAISI